MGDISFNSFASGLNRDLTLIIPFSAGKLKGFIIYLFIVTLSLDTSLSDHLS